MTEEPAFGNILIIDDEKDNTEIIKDILEDVNYSTMLARSAAEAKVILAANHFDLILMDVWMPGQDGISLLSEWHSEGFDTPVVMMSGHAEPSDIVKAMKLGAVDFLKKPLHDFLPILRNIMTSDEPEQKIQHVSGINYALKLKEARNIFESQYLLHHLEANDNNIAMVAEIAGLERTTLYRKLKDLGIDKK